MLQAGDTLAGYRIEAVAGVGGMGVVYRATQTSLDRPVALKVLSSTLVGNRTFRERFRREGRHAAALDHPNIIPVYEAGESNGLMFIAMRLVDGPSLADLIDRRQLSGNAAIGLLRAVASALDAAHEAGLVHRDIKPQNMLLTKGGHPYLADFGITKGSDHGGLTHNGDFVGSLNYVAPEQIEGRDVGGASDIYSLAAVLFQALTGSYPFDRDNDAALMHAHLSADPPTLSGRGITAPATLDAVFTRGMAKDPEARFPTAAALLDAAAAALAGVTAQQLERTPSFPTPGAPEPEEAPADSTQADRFVWDQPPTPPPAAASAPPTPSPIPAAASVPPAPPTPGPAPPAPRPAPLPVPPRVADRTTTDSRRPSDAGGEPDDAAPPEPSRRRWVAMAVPAAIVVALVAAPVVGYLLGHTDEPPAPVTARTAAVSVSHDATWASGAAAIEGLKLDAAVTLRGSAADELVAGRLAAFAPGFDPLPRAVRQRAAAPLKPAVVKLGGREVVRYRGTLKSGGRLWVALAPDTRGWTSVACEGKGADLDRRCAAVASSLRVAGAAAVKPGPDPKVAESLDAAVSDLNKARGRARTGLASKQVKARSAAASALADAHADAGRAVAAIEARPQEATLLTVLSRALRDQSERLERLGRAAKQRDTVAYRRARLAVRAQDARIAAALKRLSGAGYGGA